MNDLGIIYQYHDTADMDVVRQNLSSVIQCNTKNYPLIVIRSTDCSGEAWFHCDIPMYYWYQQRKVECARWLYLDWDVFFGMPVEEFCRPVWDYDISGSSLPGNDWTWFRTIYQLPAKAQPFACGIAPSCGLVMKDEVMSMLSKTFTKEFWPVISEMRTGTASKMNGFVPKQHPFAYETFWWYGFQKFDDGVINHEKKVWHPIKKVLRNDIPLCDLNSLETFVWKKPESFIGFYDIKK